MYSFDPVGSYEREACRAAGAAQSLVQPFLDNQASEHTPLNSVSIWIFSVVTRNRPFTDFIPLWSLLHADLHMFFLDLLQEPNSSTRNITSCSSFTGNRSFPCD